MSVWSIALEACRSMLVQKVPGCILANRIYLDQPDTLRGVIALSIVRIGDRSIDQILVDQGVSVKDAIQETLNLWGVDCCEVVRRPEIIAVISMDIDKQSRAVDYRIRMFSAIRAGWIKDNHLVAHHWASIPAVDFILCAKKDIDIEGMIEQANEYKMSSRILDAINPGLDNLINQMITGSFRIPASPRIARSIVREFKRQILPDLYLSPSILSAPNTSVGHIDALNERQIYRWLDKALHDCTWLPKGPDEPVHIGMRRLIGMVDPRTVGFIRKAHIALTDKFIAFLRHTYVESPDHEDYLYGLLDLSQQFQDAETTRRWIEFVEDQSFGDIPITLRHWIVGMLADIQPSPFKPSFWQALIDRRGDDHVLMAITGLISIDPFMAVDVIHRVPDEDSDANALAIKFELACSELPSDQCIKLVERISSVLDQSKPTVRTVMQDWITERTAKLTA